MLLPDARTLRDRNQAGVREPQRSPREGRFGLFERLPTHQHSVVTPPFDNPPDQPPDERDAAQLVADELDLQIGEPGALRCQPRVLLSPDPPV